MVRKVAQIHRETMNTNNNNQPKTTVKWLGIKNTDNKA